ncbi:sensor histidine kinase [Halarcobacter ebronensis]|uniref:sensor histidine kinase n=1 Tax=Halarcobacter ebronensis TaxID=1462615 RepID=UPI003C73004D
MFKNSIKVILLLVALGLNLFAEVNKDSIMNNLFVSSDGKNYKNLKSFTNYSFAKEFKNSLFIKIDIDEEQLKSDYYLALKVKEDFFLGTNVPFTIKDNKKIIKLHKDIKKDLILHFDFKGNIPNFNINIHNEFEYKYVLSDEKLFFGLVYGIMLCAFLYNFVFFLYNKEKSFLYYSLLQLSTLMLLLVVARPTSAFDYLESVEVVLIFLITTIYVVSILFNMEFLDTKRNSPLIHNILKFLLVLNFLDLVLMFIIERSFLYDYVASYVIILALLISAFVVLIKGYKPALFYIAGWVTLFVFIFVSENSFSEYNEVYLLHIGIALEALIFSLALAYKMRQARIEKERNQQIAISQSKLASMGEMLANIAHQWRQPLTHISYVLMNLKTAHEKQKLTDEYFKRKSEEAKAQLTFMSNTIEDFSNFFKVSKEKESFSLKEVVKETLNLLTASLKLNNIEVKIDSKEDIFINSYKGELVQVLFNILNNSKDEFIKKQIKEPKIEIVLRKDRKNVLIEIIDNAEGIKFKDINKVFEPYLTTKEKGLGIGLYISKTIIENSMKGQLLVENIKEGAKFIIKL